MMKAFVASILFLQFFSTGFGASVILDQNNWNEMMTGEWMVIFHAPWCPACRNTLPGWRTFGDTATRQMLAEIGEVDITQSPALTGIFLVSQLPTIIHVKDGEIRNYDGGRMPEEFLEYLKLKKWIKTEPLPWYYSPNTYHMRALGVLLRISIYVRDINSYLTEQKGFPTWLSYLSLGLITLMMGIGIGLLLVLICDFCCPPRPQIRLLLGGKREAPETGISSDNDDDSDVIENDETQEENGERGDGDGSHKEKGDDPPKKKEEDEEKEEKEDGDTEESAEMRQRRERQEPTEE